MTSPEPAAIPPLAFTAVERTAIRPGSDPLWLMSPCCHYPHHADSPCPGCGKPADLKWELAH